MVTEVASSQAREVNCRGPNASLRANKSEIDRKGERNIRGLNTLEGWLSFKHPKQTQMQACRDLDKPRKFGPFLATKCSVKQTNQQLLRTKREDEQNSDSTKSNQSRPNQTKPNRTESKAKQLKY